MYHSIVHRSYKVICPADCYSIRKMPMMYIKELNGDLFPGPCNGCSLWNVEKGSPSVAIGIYAAVLHALNNMDKDLLLVAKDDVMGRKMQDLNLTVRKRASRK